MRIEFDKIEDAFSYVCMGPQYEHSAIIDTATGEIYYVSELGDSDELPDDVEDSDRYVVLPHKNDLDLGVELVCDFIARHADNLAGQVNDIFRRRGAYSRFKSLLQSHGLLELWYKYEEDRSNAALRNWCSENGIEIRE
jgi:hypothetical protein